jgi:CHASE3 domain sensor protein
MEKTTSKEEKIRRGYIIERMKPYLETYNLDDLLDLYLKVKENSIKLG